jgi:hypothetical protein
MTTGRERERERPIGPRSRRSSELAGRSWSRKGRDNLVGLIAEAKPTSVRRAFS